MTRHQTRTLLVLFVTLFACLPPLMAGAHTSADGSPTAASAPSTTATDVVSGTVEALVVEDRVRNVTASYPLLRQDDGTTIPLVGSEAGALPRGARVGIVGRWDGRQFEVAQAQVLSTPSAPSPPPGSSQVEGILAIAHADDFASGTSQFIYEVHDDSGGVTTLELTALPTTLRGGMRIAVSGQRGSDPNSLRPQTITILSDPSRPSDAGSSFVVKSVTTNKVLVIMANFNNTAVPAFTQAQAQAVMISNANSVSNYYSETSYGQQLLNVTVTPWVTMNMASPATCDFSSIGTAANAAATAAGYNPSNYTFVGYLFPPLGSCGWSGLAYVSFPKNFWINGPGSFFTLVVAHEMGHNFGLFHAGSLNCGAAVIGGSCGVAEYGDPWDTMGNQRAMHFNAIQKSGISFIPSSSVKTHSSGTASYTLDPLEQGGGALYGVVVPTSNPSRTYFLEFRQPIGFDAPLASYPTNGAQIRLVGPFEWTSGADDTEILDMTPGSASGFLDSALVVGNTYTDGTYGVSITVTSATASALTVSITKSGGVATTTTLVSSANPSNAGANVTFTASVTGTAPTGTVNFLDGGVSIGGCAAVVLAGAGNTRSAACSTASLAGGTHNLTAVYSGDAGNASSTSSALSQVVNKVTSTTALATSLTPSTAGVNVTFTATITATAPTGTVNFKDGANSIAGCSAVAVTGSGNVRTAQCSIGSLTVATHSITAVYSGDANNNASASGALSQVVNKAASNSALASSTNPAALGASVTLTASVTAFTPTGNVNFLDGGSSISGCSAVALGGSGNTRTALCTTSALAAGTHSIVASYAGDANNNGSQSAPLSQVVNGSGGSINVALASNGAVASASSTYSSAYPASAFNNGDRAGLNFGAGGVWKDATNAVYPDWVQVNFSSAQTINKVIVYSMQDNNTAPVDPSDTLTFSRFGLTAFDVQTWNGAAWVTQGSVSGNNLVKRAVSFAAISTDRIRVLINASANGKFSFATELEAWTAGGGGPPPTTTTLTSSLNPSIVGQLVTFTATVSGASPTGSVNFTDGGSSISGCAAVLLSAGSAQCPTSSLSQATHSIVAAYSGDAGNAPSQSAPLSQVVNGSGGSVNVALASNGAVASASSTYSSAYPASAINNGDRAGLNFGAGGAWKDATNSIYPDWVQVNFSSAQTINKIIVYSMQDNYTAPVDPSNLMTFTLYGLTAFDVQTWNGAAWVTQGSVSGNNLVKRTVSFTAVSTDRIRVLINASANGKFSFATEIEAWTP